jgi:putative colanic acid biosynthesis UDP-glucose lipid carrier transferase
MYVYLIYQTLAWFVIAFLVKFYEVFRFTTPVEIISKYLSNSVFSFSYYSFFPFSKTSIFSGKAIAIFMTISFIIIVFLNISSFFYLKKYRLMTHNNYRNAIIIGYTSRGY